ncbi:hypothetical protein, partial [Corallococcus interemptor]|uniref:hypothetical protein n=1 Tax=Corallococcus interemptor TaxID=2316720 RepID=UPI001ABF6BF3
SLLAALFSAALEGEDALKKLTAVSAIHYCLGLLFGFQRPSRLLRLCCLPVSLQPAGLQLLFQFAVSVNFAFCVLRAASKFLGAVQ